MEEDDVQLGAEENDKADHCRQTVHENQNIRSRQKGNESEISINSVGIINMLCPVPLPLSCLLPSL